MSAFVARSGFALALLASIAVSQAPAKPRPPAPRGAASKSELSAPAPRPTDYQKRAADKKASRPPAPVGPIVERPAIKPSPGYNLGDELDPELRLVDADGRLVQIGDARGKPLVMIFWSSECGLCAGNAKRISKLCEAAQPFGATFAAVHPNLNEIDRDAREPFGRLRANARRLGIAIPLWIDVRDGLTEKLGATVTPEVFVLDEKGALRYHGAFDDEPRGDNFDPAQSPVMRALAAIRKGSDAPAPPGPVRGTSIKRWSIIPVVLEPDKPAPRPKAERDEKSEKPDLEQDAAARKKAREDKAKEEAPANFYDNGNAKSHEKPPALEWGKVDKRKSRRWRR
jgi:hypothetical protein